MINNIQSLSALKHCKLLTAINLGIKGHANDNQVKYLWNKNNSNCELTFKFKPIFDSSLQKDLSIRNVSLLNSEFEGCAETFYYGLLGTCLWDVLSHSSDAHMAATDLCQVLGVHPEQLNKMTDDELILLAIYFPDCLLFVFTYLIYRYNSVLLMSDASLRSQSILESKFDLLLHYTDLGYYLDLYGLNLERLIELNSDSSWFVTKGRPDKRATITDTLFIKTHAGYQTTLGTYISLAVEEQKAKGFINFLSDAFISEIITPVKSVFWSQQAKSGTNLGQLAQYQV